MSGCNSTIGTGRRSSEITGRAVLVCLVCFFAVIAGVNAVMIKAAVSTFGGVETENAYRAGLAFAEDLAAAHAQDTLRWRVEARVSSHGRQTLVELTVNDDGNRPLAGLQASGRLAHPTDKRGDHVISFSDLAPGSYRGVTEPVSGQWILVIDLSRAGTRLFQSRNRIVLR
jgi:nitrogen fixation protein FixH